MTCEKCGAELVVGSFPFCRGNQSDHGRGVSTVVGDEIDEWQVMGTKHPIHFRSRIERARWRKEHGYRVYDTHVGEQGSDKSKHTRSWATHDPVTAENVRILIERAFHAGVPDEADDPPLNIRWVNEETGL